MWIRFSPSPGGRDSGRVFSSLQSDLQIMYLAPLIHTAVGQSIKKISQEIYSLAYRI